MSSQTSQLAIDPAKLRADFPILEQSIHRQKRLIYFDNAASTQRPDQVIKAMNDCYHRQYANVHRGTHWLSNEASKLYEQARITVQRFLNARRSHEVIFTSGTTAAINTVARSWGDANVRAGDEILLTLMEHHSNIVPWQQLAQRTGAKIRWAGLTDDGRLDLDDFKEKLTERTKIVAAAAVSNTLGTINPVPQMVRMAHEVGAKILLDAAQQVPHAVTDVLDWNADFITFSGHKMLGPTGIGVLYAPENLLDAMPPFMGGGSMIKTVTTEGFTPGDLPAKFEAGTPPIVEAIGLAAAIDYLSVIDLDSIADFERQMAEKIQELLGAIDGVRILGPSAEHTCGIVSFVAEGVSAVDLSMAIDLEGVALRAGHHCTMPLHKHLNIPASCRASIYVYNTLEEVHAFAEALAHVLTKLR